MYLDVSLLMSLLTLFASSKVFVFFRSFDLRCIVLGNFKIRAQTLELGRTGQKIRHEKLHRWNLEEVSGAVTTMGVPDGILVCRDKQQRSLPSTAC